MTHHTALDHPSRHVLVPWSAAEAMSVNAAAKFMSLSEATVRRLCGRKDIGRRIGGVWFVSRVAALAYMEGNRAVLDLYLAGNRTDPRVREYFRRAGVPCETLAKAC